MMSGRRKYMVRRGSLQGYDEYARREAAPRLIEKRVTAE